MAFIKSALSFIIALFYSVTGITVPTVGDRAKDFRIVAYAVGGNFTSPDAIDASHFTQVTDVILFGVCGFNEKGEITKNDNFDLIFSNVRTAMTESGARIYINLIGPGATGSFDDWNEQMYSQSDNHNKAFSSGILENNIKAFLDEYGFDGVFFDYEYPVLKEDSRAFGDFIVSLDKTLGDEYVIGAAISAWCSDIGRKAIKALDMVEVMAYDIWEKDGTHASEKAMRSCARQMLAKGYKKSQLDVGIPFYARPTNGDAYWYGYNGWYDKLDEKGFCLDPGTGLTFSFNNYDTVKSKTEWLIKHGYGGAMVWHYSCDVPAENPLSLFGAMNAAKTGLLGQIC